MFLIAHIALLLAIALTQIHQCIDEIDPLVQREAVAMWSGHANAQCKVKIETLATIKKTSLVAGWYRWPIADMPKYSVVALVVFQRSNVITPLITRVESEDISRFANVRMATISGDRVLEILSCLNGTGGCWQEFFAWRSGALSPVATNYRDAFNKKLPAGLTTYKSPNLDLMTMTIKGGGWRDGKDPNCCPSIIMTCKVALAGELATLSACRTAEKQ